MHGQRRGEGLDVRAWPIREAPKPLLAVLLCVELIAAAALVGALVLSPFTAHSVLVTGYVVLIAVAYEETMVRAARMRIRLGVADLHQDMQAVWGVAAALALPPSAAVLVVLVLSGYAWLRQDRPAGKHLYRALFNAANAVLSCLAAGAVFEALSGSLLGGSWALSESLAAAAAIAGFTAVNRIMATAALLAMRLPWRAMIGTRDENLIEIATLCLGGLVALALAHEPLLAVLVLAPLITLQRGAVVRELEAAATTDAKTGLLNAVAWEQIAAREVARSARDHTDIAVLIIDVDHFKRVNDRFGHLVGDKVLRVIGRALSGGVREYDTVARFGGEEFVAVLPEATADAAMAVAERLRARVNELWVSHVVEGIAPESDELLAVSIGVATCFDGAVDTQQLLYAADGALYRAKELGRNRVVLAGDADSHASDEVWLPVS